MSRVTLIVPRNPSKPLETSEIVGQVSGWGCVSLGTLLLQHGHEVEILDESSGPLDPDAVEADIVGLSIMTATAKRGYELADSFRREGRRVILGGAHASALPEEAAAHADCVVVGEGENAIARAVESRSPARIVQGTPVGRLDDLPLPDAGLALGRLDGQTFAPVFTSRGCPWGCDFCSESAMFGRRYRERGLDGVLAELALYEGRAVGFYDANLGVDRQRLKDLLRRMLAEDAVPPAWAAEATLDLAADGELLGLMRQTNCRALLVGIETLNPQVAPGYRKLLPRETRFQVVWVGWG